MVIGQTAHGSGSQSNHALHHPEASRIAQAWAYPPTSGQADLIGWDGVRGSVFSKLSQCSSNATWVKNPSLKERPGVPNTGDPHFGASFKGPGEVLRAAQQGKKSPLLSRGKRRRRHRSGPREPPGALRLSGLSTGMQTAFPRGEAVHAHHFTFLQDQIPLEISTINLFLKLDFRQVGTVITRFSSLDWIETCFPNSKKNVWGFMAYFLRAIITQLMADVDKTCSNISQFKIGLIIPSF